MNPASLNLIAAICRMYGSQSDEGGFELDIPMSVLRNLSINPHGTIEQVHSIDKLTLRYRTNHTIDGGKIEFRDEEVPLIQKESTLEPSL